ncbi:site-specific integrase [Mesoterricola silvestris]|uniref:Integrase/recombinase y4rF n=1 Tax=Mesoterricola silvestris TaxID=2927979 RepID=A0AA48GWB5_9BACT|nr:site-specific integrase [Mesoterricola silvestris]BDU71518.1 putative integrase/recombinase y4rF [Mesoterricola silvestris]
MLLEMLPVVRQRVSLSSLPVLGPSLGDYVDWMLERGYPRRTAREYLRQICRLEERLLALGVTSDHQLTREALLSCREPWHPRADPRDFLPTLVNSLDRYFLAQGRFHPPAPAIRELKALAFGEYLRNVRGFAPVTIQRYESIIQEFLVYISFDGSPERLRNIDGSMIESFVKFRARRAARAHLQKIAAAMRGFFKFLAMSGDILPGLEDQIVSSRVYRGERLPRALSWESVQAFLNAIDRSTPMGKRDYAIFLLMATYGLRAVEVGTLALENIDWRLERISLIQTKTGNGLTLPLTDEVGASLVDYLRHGRPPCPVREVFLRVVAPTGPLGPQGISYTFRSRVKRCGLPIPFKGPHCLRHSLAVHLLRQGGSLKEIGDVLGHKNAESTCVYIRLAVEDLREVALSLPTGVRP